MRCANRCWSVSIYSCLLPGILEVVMKVYQVWQRIKCLRDIKCIEIWCVPMQKDPIQKGQFSPDEPAQSCAVAVRDPPCLSGLLATGVLTVSENGALTINPSIPCLHARSAKGSLVIKGNCYCCCCCCRGNPHFVRQESSIMGSREDEESFWKHQRAQ